MTKSEPQFFTIELLICKMDSWVTQETSSRVKISDSLTELLYESFAHVTGRFLFSFQSISQGFTLCKLCAISFFPRLTRLAIRFNETQIVWKFLGKCAHWSSTLVNLSFVFMKFSCLMLKSFFLKCSSFYLFSVKLYHLSIHFKNIYRENNCFVLGISFRISS